MGKNDENLRKNAEGYSDPTAYEAIKKVDEDYLFVRELAFNKLLRMIFDLCELAGFHVEGRIILKDKETGNVWK